MTPPTVSVIIPLFNLAQFVGGAIESVLASAPSPEEVEVVVVDDGSTDDGAETVREFGRRVRYVWQENRGLAGARNTGIRESHAPFLLFLDADDRILPEFLPVLLPAARALPETGVVHCGVRWVGTGGGPLPQQGWSRAEGDVLERLVLGNLILMHSALLRRDAVERVSGFDGSLRFVEDWDFWLRLASTGTRFACVDRALVEYRIRPTAMHHNAPGMAEGRVQVLDRFFAAPHVSSGIRRLRSPAYRNAALVSAGEHYGAGDPSGGRHWFNRAVAHDPSLVAHADSLRRFTRAMLPMGFQTGTIMAVEWLRLARALRGALRGVFGTPELLPAVREWRWAAEIAYWRTIMPWLQRRIWMELGPRRRHRLVDQQRALRAFEGSR